MNTVQIFLEAHFSPAVCCMCVFFVCSCDLGHCCYVDGAWYEAVNDTSMRLRVVNSCAIIDLQYPRVSCIMLMIFSDRNSDEKFYLLLTSESIRVPGSVRAAGRSCRNPSEFFLAYRFPVDWVLSRSISR